MRFSVASHRLLSVLALMPLALWSVTGCASHTDAISPAESSTSVSADPSETPEALGAESALEDSSASAEPSLQSEPAPASSASVENTEPVESPAVAPETPAAEETSVESSAEVPSPSVPGLTANEQENAAMKASAEELQKADEERAAALTAQGKDPEDPYLKYGDILCGNGILPAPEEIKAMGAGDAYLAWYTKFAESAPQEVKAMSDANRTAAETNSMVKAQPDRQKCAQYGLGG